MLLQMKCKNIVLVYAFRIHIELFDQLTQIIRGVSLRLRLANSFGSIELASFARLTADCRLFSLLHNKSISLREIVKKELRLQQANLR